MATTNHLKSATRFTAAAGLALAAMALMHTSVHASAHRVALIVDHGVSWSGARLLVRCLQFSQDAISGLALLELAGINSGQPPQVYDWGGGALTVCQVDREPRQIPDRCFGPTSGPNWSDWHRSAAGWVPRTSGATGYTVRDGDTEGWTYSSGFGAPPPSVEFSQVCRAPAAPVASSVVARGSATRPAQPATVTTPRGTASPTPSIEALAPSASPGVQAVASSRTPAREPSGRPPGPPLVLFGATLVLLAGLSVWNGAVRRRS
ncbi:MAG TPA: hypothetical protein VIN39_09510 [Candidatus Dormibacteraeota bacterium]